MSRTRRSSGSLVAAIEQIWTQTRAVYAGRLFYDQNSINRNDALGKPPVNGLTIHANPFSQRRLSASDIQHFLKSVL